MENCGNCRHYANGPVQGPSCSRTGKAVSFLMVKDCYEPKAGTTDGPTKVCNRCHRSLPLTEFNRKASAKDGYQFQCKECQAEMARRLYGRRKDEQKDAPKPETKVCRQCGRELPVSMFGHAPKNKSGIKSYCRDCENENCRKYRERRRAERKKDKPVENGPADAVNTVLTTERFLELLAAGEITITITFSKKQI